MKKKPAISVVIINKSERMVKDTLEALKEQTSAGCELVVIDASLGKLDDIYDQYPFAHVHPFVSTSKKRITIPEQRNVGIQKAKGDIIIFIDAGCIPVADWLKILTRPIVEQDERIVAGGTLSTGKATFHDQVYKNNLDATYIHQAPTINLAIHKNVFKQVGYFDENLLYGSDFDFTWRVNKAGIKIRNAPDALVRHDWGTFKQELKRGYRYGQAKTKLYRKHKSGLKAFLRAESTMVMYSAFLLLLPVAIFFPLYLALLLVPFIKSIVEGNGLALPLINFSTAIGGIKTILD